MNCQNCNEGIEPELDTRYETVTPIDGGGTTTSTYCSVLCLNEDVGFSEDDIQSLMRQARNESPLKIDNPWTVDVVSNLEKEYDTYLEHVHPQSEFFLVFDHLEKDFGIQVRWVIGDEIYHVELYSYEESEGEATGYETVDEEYTAVTQRAFGYAEEFMNRVESR
jgi:hypothetical protein